MQVIFFFQIIKERKDFHEETNGCFLKDFMQSESPEESVTEVEYYGCIIQEFILTPALLKLTVID